MNDYQINQSYLTQKELAERWRVSQGTIINLRRTGSIPFFSVPGSSKILYPVDGIIYCEQQHTTTTKEEQKKQKGLTESSRKKPVVSTKSRKKWRI